MANVPQFVIIPWPSTVASIPAGWIRKTGMDTVYVRGADALGDTDLTILGNLVHSHTETGHTPIQDGHTHDVSSGGPTGTVNYNSLGSNLLADQSHAHGTKSSNSTIATNQSASITINTTSNDPPFRKVIWLESDGTPTGFPSGSYIFFNSDVLPTNWTRQEGGNYLKGADAAGDGTGTGGSIDSHAHVSPAHTHTQNSHVHDGISAANDIQVLGGGGVGNGSADGHTHDFTLDSTTATNNSTTITLGNSDGQPINKKLNVLRNDTLGTDWPIGSITLWSSTNASIPSGWIRFTQIDTFFTKGCAADGQLLTQTGSATHSHSATSCQPTSSAHNHTSTVNTGSIIVNKGTALVAAVATTGHTHVWTVNNTAITNQAATVTINSNASESSYPQYVKMIFIQFTGSAGGGDSGFYRQSYDKYKYGWTRINNY